MGQVVLGGTEEYGYAGEERTLVWSIFSLGGIHWDQTTGVLTQADWEYSPTLHAKYVLDKTSLWGSQRTGLDSTLIISLGVVVAAIILIVLFFIRRKKKDQEEQ
jgi:LPXTG-motif cell wall-anchored protein